jgi:hypothetical protein
MDLSFLTSSARKNALIWTGGLHSISEIAIKFSLTSFLFEAGTD